MRKITRDAVRAFTSGRCFYRANTQVVAPTPEYDAVLFLHGSAIARRKGDTLEVSDGGWQTLTTKERLNGLPGVSVNQKDWVWYLNDREWNHEATWQPVEQPE